MEGSKRGRRESFPDIASRGSQTDPISPASWTTFIAPTNMETGKTPKAHRGLRPIPHKPNYNSQQGTTRSRLIAAGQEAIIPQTAHKRRRTIPMSNRPCDPPHQPANPKEFDLNNFCFTTLPDPHTNFEQYNDDLTIDPYTPSDRSYSGKQRRGISEPFPDATTYVEHIEAALESTFPLNEDIPLPHDLVTALEFNRDNTSAAIRDFRTSQLQKLRVIADECRHETERWYSFTDPNIASATGKVHIALLSHLSRFARMRGTNWAMQFVTGFPIVGHIHQAGVYDTDKSPIPELTCPESLFDTKSARFRARAPRATSKASQQLWDEALAQVQEGWLSPPEPLDAEGNLRETLTNGLISLSDSACRNLTK